MKTPHGYPTFEEHCVRPDGTIRYTIAGYASDMVNLALTKDDPEAFIFFMDQCGFSASNIQEARTLDGATMLDYCNRRNADKCKDALIAMFESGAK